MSSEKPSVLPSSDVDNLVRYGWALTDAEEAARARRRKVEAAGYSALNGIRAYVETRYGCLQKDRDTGKSAQVCVETGYGSCDEADFDLKAWLEILFSGRSMIRVEWVRDLTKLPFHVLRSQDGPDAFLVFWVVAPRTGEVVDGKAGYDELFALAYYLRNRTWFRAVVEVRGSGIARVGSRREYAREGDAVDFGPVVDEVIQKRAQMPDVPREGA